MGNHYYLALKQSITQAPTVMHSCSLFWFRQCMNMKGTACCAGNLKVPALEYKLVFT